MVIADIFMKKDDNLRALTRYVIPESAANSITNTYATPFALALGASNAEIGLLNAAKNLAATVAQLPGAMLTAYTSRKAIWIYSSVLARLIWLPIVLLPLIAATTSIMLFIAVLAVSTFFLSLNGPAWTSLAGDLVPDRIRGSYFGRRNMIANISGLAAVLVSGLLLAYGFPVIFLASVLLGLVSVQMFIGIREPRLRRVFHYRHEFTLDISGIRRSLMVNRNLALFTVFVSVLYFSVNIAGPFFVVYMLKDLSISYLWFAVLTAFAALVTIASQPYWGRLIDRFGERKVMIINGVMVTLVPLFYILAANPLHLLVIELFTSFSWAGFELALFSYLLAVTPADKRPVYVARHTFCKGVAIVAGTLLGGFLATAFAGSHLLWLAGLQLVFLVSFALRVASLLLLPLFGEPAVRQSDLIPVRYIFWRSMAVDPVKGILHALEFTFHYPYEMKKLMEKVRKKAEYYQLRSEQRRRQAEDDILEGSRLEEK